MNIVQNILPPFIYRYLQSVRSREYGFHGNYSSWPEALEHARGYADPAIFEKIKNAALQVKSGAAAYERDTVLFDRIQYCWPLLSALLYYASRHNGNLNVVDFGGSLGSSYVQNRKFLSTAKVQWQVVEQPHIAAFGSENIADDHLHFYSTVTDALTGMQPGVLLMSSILPYLENPWHTLAEVAMHGFELIVLDRTIFSLDGTDRLTVQRVSPDIYNASYPHWFLGQKRLVACLQGAYELLEEFDALGGETNINGKPFGITKGMIWIRKDLR